MLFSITPALRLSSPAIRDGLAEGSRGSAGTIWRRVGSRLVVVELAMAMVLLVCAGLLGKSLYRLLQVDLGFQPGSLVTLQIAAPDSDFGKQEQAIQLAREIETRTKALPGVEAVGLVGNGLPLGGNGNTTWFRILGRPWHGEHNESPERDVSSGYFAAVGAKLARGRYFTEADGPKSPKVVIVNQAMVRQYFPGEAARERVSYLSIHPCPWRSSASSRPARRPLDAPIPRPSTP